jgi:hypothetical protein
MIINGNDMYGKIVLFAISTIGGSFAAGTLLQLAYHPEDANGCLVSPDNRGCVMNRPIDVQRRMAAESENIWEYPEFKALISDPDR